MTGRCSQPITVLHLVDEEAGPEVSGALRLLFSRLDRQRFVQRVAVLGHGPHLDRMNRQGLDCQRVPLGGRGGPGRSLALARWMSSRLGQDPSRPDVPRMFVIHAHGPRAALSAVAAGAVCRAIRRTPILAQVGWRPTEGQLGRLAGQARKMRLRFVTSRPALAGVLGSAGVPSDRVTVVHPALDGEAVRSVDRAAVRHGLGLADRDGPVVLAGGWCRRRDCQKLVLWAGAVLRMIYPNLRVVAPGDSDERDRLARWIGDAGFRAMAVFPGGRFDWPELVSVADVLVHGAGADSPPEPIGWAMLAGVPVVAAGLAEGDELLRHGQTGLVCPARPRELAMQVQMLLADGGLRKGLADRARNQALARFSPDSALEVFLSLYAGLARDAALPAPARCD